MDTPGVPSSEPLKNNSPCNNCSHPIRCRQGQVSKYMPPIALLHTSFTHCGSAPGGASGAGPSLQVIKEERHEDAFLSTSRRATLRRAHGLVPLPPGRRHGRDIDCTAGHMSTRTVACMAESLEHVVGGSSAKKHRIRAPYLRAGRAPGRWRIPLPRSSRVGVHDSCASPTTDVWRTWYLPSGTMVRRLVGRARASFAATPASFVAMPTGSSSGVVKGAAWARNRRDQPQTSRLPSHPSLWLGRRAGKALVDISAGEPRRGGAVLSECWEEAGGTAHRHDPRADPLRDFLDDVRLWAEQKRHPARAYMFSAPTASWCIGAHPRSHMEASGKLEVAQGPECCGCLQRRFG